MKARVQVVVGVIYMTPDTLLISKRPNDVHQGGFWEFPGGKLDKDEQPEQGLIRELYEELGISAEYNEPWFSLNHDYPDKSVELIVFKVLQFSGQPHGREGQSIKVVPIKAINEFAFPAANQAIIEQLQLLGN